MATAKRIVDGKITICNKDYAKREEDSILSDNPPIINHFHGFNGGGLGWQENQCKLLNLLLDNPNGFTDKKTGWIRDSIRRDYPHTIKIGVDCNENGYYDLHYEFSAKEVNEGIKYLADRINNDDYCYGRGAGQVKRSVLSRMKT